MRQWDRAAARARAEAATPGPWRTYDSRGSKGVELDNEDQLFIENFGVTRAVNPADAEFIAHARADLPAALDAIDRVHALHRSDGGVNHGEDEPLCLGCTSSRAAYYVPYPCPTVRALDGDDRG